MLPSVHSECSTYQVFIVCQQSRIDKFSHLPNSQVSFRAAPFLTKEVTFTTRANSILDATPAANTRPARAIKLKASVVEFTLTWMAFDAGYHARHGRH